MIVEGEEIVSLKAAGERLPGSEYDSCRFVTCNFQESDLSEVAFIDCEFVECNLGNSNVKGSAFKDVKFNHCKMLGIDWSGVNQFLLEMHFQSCQLDYSSFYELKLERTTMIDCQLNEVDFTAGNFKGTDFSRSDFLHAIFDNTIVEECDFREVSGLQLDPERNYIEGSRFSREGLEGLLVKYGIQID